MFAGARPFRVERWREKPDTGIAPNKPWHSWSGAPQVEYPNRSARIMQRLRLLGPLMTAARSQNRADRIATPKGAASASTANQAEALPQLMTRRGARTLATRDADTANLLRSRGSSVPGGLF